MKGFFKLTTAALALVALASCNDDLFENGKTAAGQAGEGLQVEVEEMIDGITTRAAYVPNGTANKLYWQNGDMIRVFDETLLQQDTYEFSEKRSTFENNQKDIVKTPAFAFTDEPWDPLSPSPYFTRKTSSYWNTTKDQVIITYDVLGYATGWAKAGVDNEIASTKGNKVKAYDFSLPMWGEATKTDAGVKVNMKYLTGVLRVQMDQLPADWSYIKITGWKDQAATIPAPMTGTFKAIVAEDDEINQDTQLEVLTNYEAANLDEVDLKAADYYANTNVINVNLNDWNPDEMDFLRANGGYIYLPLIAQSYGALMFEYSADGINYKLYKKTKPVDVKRGTVYRMNVEEFAIAGSDAESLNVLLEKKKDVTGAVKVETTYPTEMKDDKNVISIPAGFKAESLTLDLAGIDGTTSSNPFELESADGKYAGDVVLDLSDGDVTNLNNIYLNLPNSNVTIKGYLQGVDFGSSSAQNQMIVKSLTIAAISDDDVDKGNKQTEVGDIYPNYESFQGGVTPSILVAEKATAGTINMKSVSENGDKYISSASIQIDGTCGKIDALVKNPAYNSAPQDKESFWATIPVTVGEKGQTGNIETPSNVTIAGKTGAVWSEWGNIAASGEASTGNLTAKNKSVTLADEAQAVDVKACVKADLSGKAKAAKIDAVAGADGKDNLEVALSGEATATTIGATLAPAKLSIAGAANAGTATVKEKGTAEINLTAEGEAIKGSLTMKDESTLTLTQGYIKALAGGSAKDAKLTFGTGEGFTAIASVTNKVKATNASSWNGQKINKDKFAAYLNLTEVWTADMLASNDFKVGINMNVSIDLKNIAWTPVADPAATITFDGKTNKLLNLTINGADDKGTGLIKSVANATTIQNLTVEGATISASGKDKVAVLVGEATAALTISKVNIKTATVTGKYQLGGVSGASAGITVTESDLSGITFTASAAKTTITTDDTANPKAGSVGFLTGVDSGTLTIDDKSKAGTLNRTALGFKENFKTQTGGDGILRFYYYYPGSTFFGQTSGTLTTSGAFDGMTDKGLSLEDAVVNKGLNYYLLNSKWN